MLRYKGAAHFRQRIILATLSGRAVRIDDIRSEEEQVGLRDYEACFLRLLEKVVNGCEIVINETGTAMRYRPGIIVGGGGHVHECGTSRAISYFIQPLLALAPFGKLPLAITLRGVTNATGDVGVDVLRTVTLPMLRHFGLSEGLSLQVNKRGAPPLGGGEVYMQMAIVRELTPCDLTETGRVKRVRGAKGERTQTCAHSAAITRSRCRPTRCVANRWRTWSAASKSPKLTTKRSSPTSATERPPTVRRTRPWLPTLRSSPWQKRT